MSVSSFIPKLWNARLLHALNNTHVAANLVNRDYEGEIKGQGDTVHINSIGRVTVKDYTRNTDIDAAETLATEDQTLVIDQAKYFNFQVDDVDKVQAAGELIDAAMSEAAYALADVSDKFLLAKMAEGATASHVKDLGTTPITAATVYEQIVGMRTVLDKANVPNTGRFLVIPPEVYSMLLLDTNFVKASDGGTANKVLLNGEVGSASGFKIYMSNNLPFASSGAKYSIIAGISKACTYAEQIIETKAYEMEKRFNDAVKGLHVYGAKVTNGDMLAVVKAKVSADAGA